MKRVFSILKILMSILLCLEPGCSTNQTKHENTGINSYNLQSDFCSEPGRQESAISLDTLVKENGRILTGKKTCRIKYHKLSFSDRNIVVEGEMGIEGNKYPVVLDTGASQAIVLNSELVKKKKLPVYPIENGASDFNGHKPGICKLSELDIGEITLADWFCIYLESNGPPTLFGIPIASSTYGSENIILGLPLLREFKYIEFDNMNSEAELSYYKSFEPLDDNKWEKYPISIEEDFHGNAFLFVRLSITGEETELQLDTGSGRGMAIKEELWEKIRNNLDAVKLKKGRDFYPYIGNLTCKKGKVPVLELGNRIIKNADISVFKDDSTLLDGCDGLVGMQYFMNTVLVLDFEHELMWLREIGM